jgi:hypothetical protein
MGKNINGLKKKLILNPCGRHVKWIALWILSYIPSSKSLTNYEKKSLKKEDRQDVTHDLPTEKKILCMTSSLREKIT